MSIQMEPKDKNPNMPSYDEASSTFSWEDVKKQFSWNETNKVNMAYEAIDRHANSWRKNKVALYYNDRKRNEKYTFQEMKFLTNQFGNVLLNMGVEKGDQVFLFMPKIPETYISILGTIKVGAIVAPLYDSFMRQALYDRLQNSNVSVIVTTRKLLSRIPFEDLPNLKHIIVADADELPEYEIDTPLHLYDEVMEKASSDLTIRWMDLEDEMILHYTSGSTGIPKGVLHAHRAMIQHYQTAKWVLDLKEDDIFWCTAEPGWITGTSYGVFGPWLNGAANLVRGERFTPKDCYHTIEKYRVTVWLSAPTLFRRLMSLDNELAESYDLSSVRHMLSVGEPISSTVIHWAMDVFKTPIYDHWWMTETGGIMIANYRSMPIKPGSMGRAFPGIRAAILDEDGNELPNGMMGHLCVNANWPAMLEAIWRDEGEYDMHFPVKDWFYTGDLATQDEEGYFWFKGRNDDVITTSGERIGPFEIESKLIEHPAIAEAAVIGQPDPTVGEVIKAYVALRDEYEDKDKEHLRDDIKQFIKDNLATNSAPRDIEFREFLPKTHSGKLIRHALKPETDE